MLAGMVRREPSDLVDVALVGPLGQLDAEAVDVLDAEDDSRLGPFQAFQGWAARSSSYDPE